MSRTMPVLVVLVLLAAALVAGGGGAATAAAAPAYAPEEPWATGAAVQTAPRFDETWWLSTVVWESNATDSDVVVWSLAPSFLITLPAGPAEQIQPDVGEQNVVYADDRNGDWDIYLCEAGSYTSATPPDPPDIAVTSGGGDQLDPAIYGGTVVYEDSGAGNCDIWSWDLTTREARRLTTNAADQIDPSIEGDQVVFADRRKGNWDIYLFDLATGKLKQLTTNGAAQAAPQISTGSVVYQDHRNGNWDIYLYDLRSGRERRLTSEKHDQTAPQISNGRTVVYEDRRGDVPHIYLYDLRSRTNRPVTNDPAGQTQPDVSGDRVAWTDARSDAGDIYGCQLGYPGFSFRAPSETPRYDQAVIFRGALNVPDGDESGLRVRVTGLGTPRLVPVNDTDEYSAGTFSVTLKCKRKVTLRAAFAGDAGHLPSYSVVRSVTPRALLTRPTFTKVPQVYDPATWPRADYAITGTLKPHHKAGSRAVQVQFWQQDFLKEWKLYRTYRPAVKDGNGGSTYRMLLHLSSVSLGRWKVRTIHDDGDHARTISAFSAVRP